MVLTATSSRLAHAVQNLALIAFSFALFPLNTFILALSYYRRTSTDHPGIRQRNATRADPSFKPKRVLVTGVGMTKGLTLARLFHRTGHDVIGADFEPGSALVCGRVSVAVQKFYRLVSPSVGDQGSDLYLKGLLDVIRREKIDMWVSCSGVASAVEDGLVAEVVEAETGCRVVQFDAKTTQTLHEKNLFIERAAELGLVVPETVEVSSRQVVEDVLRLAPKGRKYILKTIGVDDSVRADMTLLPKEDWKDTKRHLDKLRITTETPWIVQQFIDGLEFCTHSLVVRGEVKAFVACPSAELLMHYSALPAESALSTAMLEFTKTFAEKSGPNFTGHLSFDFLVERDDLNATTSDDITLYPIECNPRAHTAVVLFKDTPELAAAYMTLLEGTPKPSYADVVDVNPTRTIVIPRSPQDYYWTGHDLLTKLILPVLNLVLLRVSLLDFVRNIDLLLEHAVYWTDGTYEAWDPLPWWWLYQIYWPMRFFYMFRTGRKWSRVNVSTGKIFEC